uniref:Uncharacterized protein n=1 Tax=Taeniopygia guttata TaxID=59729 RepID=A0A674HCA0_TAEGU
MLNYPGQLGCTGLSSLLSFSPGWEWLCPVSDSVTGGTGGGLLRPGFDPLAAGVNLLGLFPAFLPFQLFCIWW